MSGCGSVVRQVRSLSICNNGAKRHVLVDCWVADKDKMAPGGTEREEMVR